MSRLRSTTALALGALLIALGGVACEEDGKTAPARCSDPPLPEPFDILHAGAPADDNADLPCSTPIGHAVSSIGASSGGTSSNGGAASGGKTSASGGSPDAGAGGGS
jgi:hypothetical protein